MNEEGTFRERVASRKFLLMMIILLGGTSLLLAPFLLAMFTGVKLAAFMTGGEYVTLIVSTFGLYVTGNVVQKIKKGAADDAMLEQNNELG